MHASAVQTLADVPSAPLIPRSTKEPAEMVTLPVAVQDIPGGAVQASVVLVRLPEEPVRSVTVIGLACCDKTFNVVAVHPNGTQVRIFPCSIRADVGLLTE